MEKIVLKKDYPIRHDIRIHAGSSISVSENKAAQLKEKGFVKEKKELQTNEGEK